jgi:transposase InsO family protein
LELVNCDYYWPSVKTFVNKYVDGCQLCQRTKPIHRRPVGPLQPLPMPAAPWQRISVDHIQSLPKSKGFDRILTVVDDNTGMTHLVKTKDTVTASETAQQYLDHIWKLHGLPREVLSNRGNTFISQFMKATFKRLGIKPLFSTAYHPQTNGKTERTNQLVEQYLHLFCNHAMDNWSDLLPLAEFAINNTVNVSTGMTPFFANYGFHPMFTTTSNASANPKADARIKVLEEIQKELKSSMEVAQERHRRYYDRNVRLGPKLKVGDEVWLEATNITTSHPSHKLSHRRLGPFPIEAKLSDLVYRLTLPNTMHIHPVFHVGLLTPVNEDTIIGRTQVQVPVPVARIEDDWTVARVKNSRWQGDQLMYEVRWKGRPAEEDSEVPYDDIKGLAENEEKIRAFHEANPEAWSLTRRPTSRSARLTARRRT